MFELNVVLERCEATAGLSEAAVPALVRERSGFLVT